MKIVRPYARIMDPIKLAGFPDPLLPMKKIEWCSRISHRAEDKQTDESWNRFIQSVVIDHGDWSVVEHVSVSVDALVDRGITHEWVRHRLFSYTQESTRFVNYEKKKDGLLTNPPSFIYPKPDVECEWCLRGTQHMGKDANYYHKVDLMAGEFVDCMYDQNWLATIVQCEYAYRSLLAKGWRTQEARSVFPNALASRIIVTGNLRNWRHFFIMRTTQESHPQMRQVTIPLLKEFQDTFPLLFDDLVSGRRQVENLRLPR